MEAMALRRPVISTYVAGIPELVIPGEHGWLVPAGDLEAFTHAMQICLIPPPILSSGWVCWDISVPLSATTRGNRPPSLRFCLRRRAEARKDNLQKSTDLVHSDNNAPIDCPGFVSHGKLRVRQTTNQGQLYISWAGHQHTREGTIECLEDAAGDALVFCRRLASTGVIVGASCS